MQRRLFSQLLVAGLLLPNSVVMAFAQELIAQNGRLPSAHKIHKIFAAGAPAMVFLYALTPEKLLGFPTDLSRNTRQYLHPDYAQLPVVGRLAGRGSTLSLEQLMLLQPDVIVDVGNANQTHRSAAQNIASQTGIPTLQIAGNLAQTPDQLKQAGYLLGVAERAEQLAYYAQGILQRAQRFKEQQHQPVRFYHARLEHGLETGVEGSIHTETYELLGLQNVVGKQANKGLVRVSLEQLLVWQPDYIFTEEWAFIQHAKKDPLWQQLKAVQVGHIYCAPRLPFGWLDSPPSLNRLLGIDWLIYQLSKPQSTAELEQQVTDFYQLFYGVKLDGRMALNLQV